MTTRALAVSVAFATLVSLPSTAALARDGAPDTYGTAQTSTLVVPASAFVPTGTATFTLVPNSGQVKATAAGENFWAPVALPTGSLVTGIGIVGCNLAGGGQTPAITARLNGYKPDDDPADGRGKVVLATAAFAGPNCASPVLTPVNPPIQVDNNPSNADGYVYGLTLDFDATALPQEQFVAAQLHYKLQVSPAPATATFPDDVPMSHPFFRFVEALAAAGITGGCGAGSYCPDAAVTRGQLAVFLATALGLHYPN